MVSSRTAAWAESRRGPLRKRQRGESKSIVVIVLYAVILWFLAFVAYNLPQQSDFHGIETNLGTRVGRTADGDWLVSITTGSKPASSIELQINDWTGAIVFRNTLSNTADPAGSPDVWFNDTDGDKNVDAGDTILLRASGGRIHSGFSVWFMRDDHILGRLKELP